MRKCIARKGDKDDHLVELADLQIVALGISYALNGWTVQLIFKDKALKDCLLSVIGGQGIGGITIVDSAALIQELLYSEK